MSFIEHIIKVRRYQELNKGSKLCRVAVSSNQLEEHSVAIRASHQQLTHLINDLLHKKAPQNIHKAPQPGFISYDPEDCSPDVAM